MIQGIIKTTVISFAVSAISTACGLYIVQNELANRPPLAIVDYSPIANAVNAGVQPETVQPFLAEYRRRAKIYREAGYIVLNGASIDAAPAEMFVPTPEDLPDDWRSRPAGKALASHDLDPPEKVRP